MNGTILGAIRLVLAVVLLVPAVVHAGHQSDRPVVLGVFPYISASQMMVQLAPLCKRLESALGKKIAMVSAPDFLSFVDRTARGEYDLVLTAAHMGRLAQKRNGWKLLVQSGQKTATVLLVRKDSGIRRLKDLRGKKLAVGNARSVTYLLAEECLRRNGLEPGRDVTVIETATFSNVVQSVFLREADVGATPTLLWNNWVNVNEAQHAELSEICRTKETIPSFLMMAPPGTSDEKLQRLQASLLTFHDTPEGRDFFRKTRFESFLKLDEATMAQIDPYVHVLIKSKAGK